MKIFYSESKPEYSSYTFNYGIYCIKENHDDLSAIYSSGFLPYSGNTDLEAEVFYLARSLRVELDRFADTSENRRVNRKIEGLGIKIEYLPKNQLLVADSNFINFCEAYVEKRIGEAMSQARLQYILNISFATDVFKFSIDDRPVGYVLCVCNAEMVHYWFSFFDIELMKSHSLGKWMMWRVIRWALDSGKKYVYLGTAYGSKSLYKVRDHKGLAYFNGTRWDQDMELLKVWCKNDENRDATDRFKQAGDANQYLSQLWEK
ncbi:MAG: GNAT family N-acetyltransferase [Saprospiraceae bacterium]|nr:GNAT family N-acetyltransferase [Saprospiraceae bacterium]